MNDLEFRHVNCKIPTELHKKAKTLLWEKNSNFQRFFLSKLKELVQLADLVGIEKLEINEGAA